MTNLAIASHFTFDSISVDYLYATLIVDLYTCIKNTYCGRENYAHNNNKPKKKTLLKIDDAYV